MNDDSTDTEVKRGDFARAKGEVILREHEYDGIQEFDQKLPNWWLFTFYIAIAWFLIYWVLYYHTGTYRTDQQKIVSKFEEIQKQKDAALAETLSSLSDKILIEEWASDPTIVANGQATYSMICIACHGAELDAKLGGVSLPGRPLNDGEWHYGKAPMAIFKMINEGTPQGSPGYNGVPMVAKGGGSLSSKQVAELTAFLISKNPADFEGAQFDETGKLVEP